MALSNIDNEHANKLLAQINTNFEINTLEAVKNNHVQYAKLKQLAKQMELLKREALQVINESNEQQLLHSVKCSVKKVSGKYYYLYRKTDGERYFSIVSPSEWKHVDTFLGKYYYDYDKSFEIIN
jgi:hypothetical protein